MRGEQSPLILFFLYNENENTMSDETQTENQKDELAILKERARMMGITFSNNIGIDALRKKVAAKQDGEDDTTNEDGEEAPANEEAPAAPQEEPAAKEAEPAADRPLTKMEMREKLRKEALALVRVRLTCMDPKKKDLPGELVTVANRYIGTVSKMIPFGSEFYENGYHIPKCLVDELQARKFLNITTRKGKQGQIVTKTNYVKEFGIEILPPLTKEELGKLAAQQAASHSLADDE